MPNPMNMGLPQMGGGMSMGNVNPAMLQKINQIAGIFQRSKDVKSIITEFKRQGISPQIVEQALCMASPQLKQIKEQMDSMKKSGMSQQDMFAAFAKQANVDPQQINDTYNNLMKSIS